MRLTT